MAASASAITVASLEAHCDELQLSMKDALRVVDADGDGVVSATELQQCIDMLNAPVSPAEARALVLVLDRGGLGLDISSYGELAREYRRSVGAQKKSPPRARRRRQRAQRGVHQEGKTWTEAHQAEWDAERDDCTYINRHVDHHCDRLGATHRRWQEEAPSQTKANFGVPAGRSRWQIPGQRPRVGPDPKRNGDGRRKQFEQIMAQVRASQAEGLGSSLGSSLGSRLGTPIYG